jgi:hypothetical protein
VGALIGIVLPWLVGKGIPAGLAKWLALAIAIGLAALGAHIWWRNRLAEERRKAAEAEQARQREGWDQAKARSEAAAADIRGLGDAAVRGELRRRHTTPPAH